MKTKIIFSSLLIGSLISACNRKDDQFPSSLPVIVNLPTNHISKDSSYDSNPINTTVSLYLYNINKQLVKIKVKKGTSSTYDEHDTLYYNSNNQVSKVERYVTGNFTPDKTNTYNYTANILTSINESGSNDNGFYVRSRTYTYTSGKLSSQSVVYTTGSGTGEPENINSITFDANNLFTVDIVGVGSVFLTTDYSTPNPYYGLNVNPEEILEMFNPNNVLMAFETASPTNIFVNNTYTFANGRVTKIVKAALSNRTTEIEYIAI